MLSLWILLFLGPVIALFLSSLVGLLRNHAIARRVGLPIVVVLISPENPLWILLGRHFVPLLKYIPFGNGDFSKFCHVGWEWELKYQGAHVEPGDAIMLVSPAKNWIYVCNADTVHDIVQRERRNDFERPVELMAILDVFGPNISTVHGADWQRQRKATASTFTEKSNRTVWDESLQQAQQMLAFWKKTGEVRTTAKDVRTLALDVLVSAGFGKSFPFQGSTERPRATTGPLSYRDSLALILENALLIVALGPDSFSRIKFPGKLGRIGQAILAFKQYMTHDFEEAKKAIEQNGATDENLMTNLVRASMEQPPAADDATGHRRTGMSQKEVFGNMFVFNFAGHDTTAHSLNYTFYLLATHPHVQDWLHEEIAHVFPTGADDISSWSYDSFSKLPRCLAVLYETLRLYNPLLSIIKSTRTAPTDLTVGDKSYTVPPHTRVVLNLNALHTHPRYWGHDALDWNPARWIEKSDDDDGAEYLRAAPRGAFMGWSEGNRACPGKKFAQVEHVAVMAGLLGGSRVEVVGEEGEDGEAARRRGRECVGESGMRLLFQMLRPERVALRWVGR